MTADELVYKWEPVERADPTALKSRISPRK
jgi:hypothetical protein